MVSLCKFKDVPKHLQYNPFILSGYRAQFSISECVKSLLYLHNETGNIYTHSEDHILDIHKPLIYIHTYIPIVVAVIIAGLGYLLKYSQLWPDTWSIVSYFLIADYSITLLLFIFSVTYHTFMCHKGGKRVYDLVLKVDVGGVWLMASLGTLPFMYTTFYGNLRLQLAVISIYSTVSMLAAIIIVSGNNRVYRAIAFASQYCVRLFVLACRLYPVVEGLPDNNLYYFMLEVLNGLGVIVNALHIPERWFPGRFDYVFNGHQLMHISTALALISFRTALIMDFEWLNNNNINTSKV